MDERRFSIVFNHLYTASDQTHPKDHDDLNKHHEYIEVNYGILPFLVLPKSSVLNLKIELIAQPMSLRIFLIRLQKIPNFEYRSQPPEPFNSFKKTERSDSILRPSSFVLRPSSLVHRPSSFAQSRRSKTTIRSFSSRHG